jgi:hypothetical protein
MPFLLYNSFKFTQGNSMHTLYNINTLLKTPTIDLYKTLTSTLNNGGAVTFQIHDAIEFIQERKLSNEIEFLLHLYQTDALTQNALECFLKHMMFNKETASTFVQWQRKRAII